MIFPGNASTVKDGVIQRLSPSAIDEFDDETPFGCPTKWYFRRVLKRSAEETDAMRRGTEMHTRIEHYLRTGEDVLGPIERAGKRYIDEVRPYIVAIESPVLIFIEGTQVDGKRDLLVRWPGDKLEVVDWKSSSNIEKYAKDDNDMRNDTQVAVYGMDALKDAVDVYSVAVANVYFQTGSRRGSDKRSALLGPGDLKRNYDRIAGLIEKMKSVAAEKDIKKVTPNHRACSVGTGCPYYAECPNRAKALHEQEIWNMLGSKFAPKKLVIQEVKSASLPEMTPEEIARAKANDAAIAADKAAFAAKQSAAAAVPEKTKEEREQEEFKKWQAQQAAAAVKAPVTIEPPEAAAIRAQKAAPQAPAPTKADVVKAMTELTTEYDEDQVKEAVAKVAEEKKPKRGRPSAAEEKAKLLAELKAAGVDTTAASLNAKTVVQMKTITSTVGFRQNLKDASGKTTYSSLDASVSITADFVGDVAEAHDQVAAAVYAALSKDLQKYLDPHNMPSMPKGGA